MQTPMQDLFKELGRRIHIIKSETTELREQMIIDFTVGLDDYLIQEKQTIVYAYAKGLSKNCFNSVPKVALSQGEQYYNEKYNNNE